MFDTCVSYYTVGWDNAGDLVGLPVMKRRQMVERQGLIVPIYVEDDISFVAYDRQCTICILDSEIFCLDDYGNRDFNTCWRIVDHIVKADDLFAAGAAVRLINRYINEALAT